MERLHKFLASAGMGSRRRCEQLIAEGKVTVDGVTVTEMGIKVDPARSRILCDGVIARPRRRLVFLLNKPRGYVCTARDEMDRRTIVELFKGVRERLYTAGRLDIDTEGAIIVTNDGALCNRITHPRYEVPKTYHAVVAGNLDERILARIRKGVWLSDGRTGPVAILIRKRMRDLTVMDVTIREGMNREIRRVFARYGLEVVHLRRIKIGAISLGSLPIGTFRPLTHEEVQSLQGGRERERETAPRRNSVSHERRRK